MRKPIFPALISLLLMLSPPAPTGARDMPGAEAPPPFARLFPAWYEPTEPFRIIGPLHYVGSKGLASFFIPAEKGHILIDGGLPENAPMIAASISALGYAVSDVRILLNTHAHFDHSGGLAELKALSGATLFASEGDVSALEDGVYLGYEERPELGTPPVEVDAVLADGDRIDWGGVSLTARLTPGHTRGCTSWTLTVTEDGEHYEVLIFGSASVALNSLVKPAQYPGIVADYQQTFERTANWTPDVFLSNHTELFNMAEKREQQLAGDPLAFVDGREFPAFIVQTRADFVRKLAEQQEAAQ